MAQLADENLKRIWAGLMRYVDFGGVLNTNKTALRAAVDAVDKWVSDNTASFVASLPEPFKTNSTANQKSLLLVAVILMRFNLDLLKRIFGEVD